MKKQAVLATLFASTACIAQAEPIQAIDVTGNVRVEDETILNYIPIASGEEYASNKASIVIKSLYDTGLFHHVEVAWNSGVLNVSVEENPLVNKIAFEGNDEISVKRLEEFLTLKPREVYSSGKVQQDVQTILAYYRQNGHFLAEIKPQLIKRDQNRVDVIFKIEEGGETEIQNINFAGNKRFADADLRTLIRTKESKWWRFLTSSDVYDPDQIEVDKEMLRRFYLKSGYADFQVVSAVAELSKEKDGFDILFTVLEGPQYRFGEVDIRLEAIDEDIDREDLFKKISTKTGNTYNAEIIESDIESLIDALGEKGFAFLDVKPTLIRNEATQTIDVAYTLVPGPRVYVNRIDIKGNGRTRDHVLRREMRLAEGDAFSTTKIKRSKDRLQYLGYFEDVSVRHSETGLPDRVDVDVTVAEQSTGEFSTGAGVSSYEGFLFNLEVKERNFLGKGQKVSVATTLSGRRQDINLSFTEPYFMNREVAAGFDIFAEERDFDDESDYNLQRQGGAVRLGFKMGEYTRDSIRLGYRKTEIKDVDEETSQFIAREEGEKNAITLSNTIAYDNRDSYIDPTRGYMTSLTTEYAGLGGDIEYLKGLAKASWHKKLKEDWVLSLGGQAGAVVELGDTLPVFEMFRLGGNNGLRGFDFSGVGPRDTVADDALGGKYIFSNSLELSYPLGAEMKEMGVKGLIFADGGLVTDFEDHPDVADSGSYRASIGTGFYWQSPMGPLRFEFATPIMKEDEDETRVFSFSFGTRF